MYKVYSMHMLRDLIFNVCAGSEYFSRVLKKINIQVIQEP